MACILLLIFTLSLFVTFFASRGSIVYACSESLLSTNSTCDMSIRLFGAEVPDPVFPVLTGAIGTLAFVGVLLIGYLVLFHLYLCEWRFPEVTSGLCMCVCNLK